MRELKFRIWDGNNKHFVYPDILELDRGLEYQQFTGLLDKQGKEIYEGDIVKQSGLIVPDIIATVEWGECLARSLGDDFTPMHGWVIQPKGYDTEPLFPFSCLEVIGNIYESRELLNGK